MMTRNCYRSVAKILRRFMIAHLAATSPFQQMWVTCPWQEKEVEAATRKEVGILAQNGRWDWQDGVVDCQGKANFAYHVCVSIYLRCCR